MVGFNGNTTYVNLNNVPRDLKTVEREYTARTGNEITGTGKDYSFFDALDVLVSHEYLNSTTNSAYRTHKEDELMQAMVRQYKETGQQLGPADIYRISLDLNNGNREQALLTAEDAIKYTGRTFKTGAFKDPEAKIVNMVGKEYFEDFVENEIGLEKPAEGFDYYQTLNNYNQEHGSDKMKNDFGEIGRKLLGEILQPIGNGQDSAGRYYHMFGTAALTNANSSVGLLGTIGHAAFANLFGNTDYFGDVIRSIGTGFNPEYTPSPIGKVGIDLRDNIKDLLVNHRSDTDNVENILNILADSGAVALGVGSTFATLGTFGPYTYANPDKWESDKTGVFSGIGLNSWLDTIFNPERINNLLNPDDNGQVNDSGQTDANTNQTEEDTIPIATNANQTEDTIPIATNANQTKIKNQTEINTEGSTIIPKDTTLLWTNRPEAIDESLLDNAPTIDEMKQEVSEVQDLLQATDTTSTDINTETSTETDDGGQVDDTGELHITLFGDMIHLGDNQYQYGDPHKDVFDEGEFKGTSVSTTFDLGNLGDQIMDKEKYAFYTVENVDGLVFQNPTIKINGIETGTWLNTDLASRHTPGKTSLSYYINLANQSGESLLKNGENTFEVITGANANGPDDFVFQDVKFHVVDDISSYYNYNKQ